MATYRYTNETSVGVSLLLNERPIYGSSRLGSYTKTMQLYNAQAITSYPPPSNIIQRPHLRYELTDHLGNVAAVVTGRLLPSQSLAPFEADLVSAQGYEPFGSLLPGRNYSSDSYAHGFNGMRKDDEIHGATGTSYDFGFRMYDSRIGRFMSVDPVTTAFPFLSPYQFASLNPIVNVDLEGLEGFNANGGGWVTNPPSTDCQGCGPIPKAHFEAVKNYYDRSPDGARMKPQRNMLYIYNPDGWGASGTRGYYYKTEGTTPLAVNFTSKFKGASSQFQDPEEAANGAAFIADKLIDYPDETIVITSNVGTESYRPEVEYGSSEAVYAQPAEIDGRMGTTGELMDARNNAVRSLLIEQGVDPNRIVMRRGVQGETPASRTVTITSEPKANTD